MTITFLGTSDKATTPSFVKGTRHIVARGVTLCVNDGTEAMLARKAEIPVQGVQPLPSRKAEKQLHSVQPLSPRQVEKRLRGVQLLRSRQAETRLHSMQPLPPRQDETQLRSVQSVTRGSAEFEVGQARAGEFTGNQARARDQTRARNQARTVHHPRLLRLRQAVTLRTTRSKRLQRLQNCKFVNTKKDFPTYLCYSYYLPVSLTSTSVAMESASTPALSYPATVTGMTCKPW